MALTTLPQGWTQDQLHALTELTSISTTYVLARDIKTLIGDNSPEAQRVLDDLKTAALNTWLRVKTFTP